jgi:hypothetical protein
MMLQELLTCRVSSVPNQQYVYSWMTNAT